MKLLTNSSPVAKGFKMSKLSEDDVIQALHDSEKLTDTEKMALIETYKVMSKPNKSYHEPDIKIVSPKEFILQVEMTEEQEGRVYKLSLEVIKLDSRLDSAKKDLVSYLESVDNSYKVSF